MIPFKNNEIKSIKSINYLLVLIILYINVFFYLGDKIRDNEILFLFFNLLILITFFAFNKKFEQENNRQKDNIKELFNMSFVWKKDDSEIKKELLSLKNKYKENHDTYNLFKNLLIKKNLLEKDYEDLRWILNKFIPKWFIKEIDKVGTDRVSLWLTQKKQLNIMFLDIVGFTTLTEKLSPDRAFLLLNVYFDWIVEIIRGNWWYIDKFLWDGLMCIFDSDKTDNAIIASIEIQNFISKFQISEVGKKISVWIGINHWDVILWTIWSRKRMEITIIWDTVNTASRIEWLTRTNKENIIITKDVYKNINNLEQFTIKELGIKQIKWKKKKIHILGVQSHINKTL